MPEEIADHRPNNSAVDDNARKFIVGTFDRTLLETSGVTSFTLTVDWLETGEDNEKKVAYKKFDDGKIQILLIAKVTRDGRRISGKEPITEEQYQDLLTSSILHLEKKRYEFTYTQSGIVFAIKYDEFAAGKLCMLEVDAPSDAERDGFDPNDFPGELTEVTGDTNYYGYRVAQTIAA